MPNWIVKIAKKAQKTFNRLPLKDQDYILSAMDEMAEHPFSGDIVRLHNEKSEWRRRVGNYRIFFDLYYHIKIVDIVEIDRRTSNTY